MINRNLYIICCLSLIVLSKITKCDVVLRKRYALLNISSTSTNINANAQPKNIILSDTAIYGINSPSYTVRAKLISIRSNDELDPSITSDRGCTAYLNQNLPDKYIALVSRGECTFDKKISIAAENKASAIIIYNNDQDVFTMLTKNQSIVNVFVSNYVGSILLSSLDDLDTYVTIKPSLIEIIENNSLPSKASVYFVFVSFIIVILITLSWIGVFYLQKYRYANAKKRLDNKLKKATAKALSKMVVRKLKSGDKELNEACIICLENYEINDQIRELPCSHYFHQKDIDLWLFENRNCPMCKIDILQACGIEIKRNHGFFRRNIERFRIRPSSLEQILNNQITNNHAILIENEQRRANSNTNHQIFNQTFNQNDENLNESSSTTTTASTSSNIANSENEINITNNGVLSVKYVNDDRIQTLSEITQSKDSLETRHLPKRTEASKEGDLTEIKL